MVTDKEIIRGCLDGQRSAQKALFEKYASTMLSICMRYSNDKSEAEDILHDSFIKIYLNIKKFRSDGSFEGWIKRIVINTALYHIRNKLDLKRFQNFNDIKETEIIDSNNDNNETEIEYEFSERELLAMIQELPDGYRAVFNMYVFEKYKHKDIAEKLSISENTSKSQLRKARILLKSKIESRIASRKLVI
jgi:RNA polymerase sigma-70 factor (ECF subfamily)